jgi:hypothetical protein
MFVMNKAATQSRQGSGMLRMCFMNWSIAFMFASLCAEQQSSVARPRIESGWHAV